MADECISVGFDTDNDGQVDKYWNYCWEGTNPEPYWDPLRVDTGLRKGLTAASKPWKTCQYWMKGMPAVCIHWRKADGEGTIASGTWACHYREDNQSDNPNDPPPDYPTGFNTNVCDNLGRRIWCDKYEPQSAHNSDEYICVAPSPYLTGLGKRAAGEEAPITRALAREEVWGYNITDDDTGTGRCDCYGMGRGEDGCARFGDEAANIGNEDVEKELGKLPIICNYYRPWQMGFGARQPRPLTEKYDEHIHRRVVTEEDEDEAYELIDQEMDLRLPLNFKLYNLRSQFQKCQWWDKDTGSQFVVTESGSGGYPAIVLEEMLEEEAFEFLTKIKYCKCTDSAADPYNHRIYAGFAHQYLTRDIKAVGAGFICNGARPECPCYSGKWKYLTEEKILAGMAVTANQILELRFWSQDWESQEQYDEFFNLKPNRDDPRSPSIFTFTKWEKLGTEAWESRALGKELSLCQPAPLNNKEFDPDIYVQITEPIRYAPPYVNIGTDAPNQRHFPTLIRDPEFPELKPLVITYPYYNDDIFDFVPCEGQSPAGHIKRHNTIYGDSITIVGQTVRNKTVYAINMYYLDIESLFKQYGSIFSMPRLQRYNAYSKLVDLIYDALRDNSEYITSGMSDTIFGVFTLDPLKLKYNADNLLLICVDYGDGTWEYRWRVVRSKWYGGILVQRTFNHTYGTAEDGYTNSQPERLDPAATITFEAKPLGPASTKDVIPIYSYDYVDIVNDYNYYNYSIRTVEIENISSISVDEDVPTVNWGAVGNSNKIWVEIDDLNLNYIYEWDIISAKMEPILDDNDDPVRPNAETVVMHKITGIDQDTIPPNACILGPTSDDRVKFIPSEWELIISYEYQELTTQETSENIISGANSSYWDRYRTPPFTFQLTDSTVQISNITVGTVGLMGYFSDEDGRLISTMATKALLNVVSERCRGLAIYYKYKAEGRQFALQPESGFCIDIKQDRPLPGLRSHVEIPACGDHLLSAWKWQGPMWFPFNACRGYDMYDEFTVCNNCQAGYVGPLNDGIARDENGDIILVAGQVVKRNDYRYSGPYKYDAWADTRGNWAAACDCGCKFYYSDATAATIIFIGYAKLRGPVNVAYYEANGWTLPPFGNDGRDLIEKFISQDFIKHYTARSLETRSEYMPLVMDNSHFYMSFDAYSPNPEENSYVLSYNLDVFDYTSQMNLFTLNTINESIDKDQATGTEIRYRFNELFDVNHEAYCTYPKPTLPISSSVSKVNYYTFKSQNHAWAWQEYWRDIERNISIDFPEGLAGEDGQLSVSNEKLDFVLEFQKPNYVFSIYKEEHRLICEEGNHIIHYTGPIVASGTGELLEYPTISLDGAHPRPFEILYGDNYDENNYDDNQVEWKNEGGSANVGGSSDEDNPYEEAAGNDWLHDDDIIFEQGAVTTTTEAEAAGRAVVISIDAISYDENYQYYNRGLIVKIPKNRLEHLPKQETQLDLVRDSGYFFRGENTELVLDVTSEYFYISQAAIPGSFVWNEQAIEITAPTEDEGGDPINIAIAKFTLTGKWGYFSGLDPLTKRPKNYILVKPGVSITAHFSDGSFGTPRGFNSVATEVEYPELDQALTEYTINMRLPLSPIEMIKKRIVGFTINLAGGENNDYFISLDKLQIYKADYIDYTAEGIKVWERKYIASKFTGGNQQLNLDGPGDNLHYQIDLDNSGLYFPFRSSTYADVDVSATDKMRGVYCGIYYPNDIDVADVTYDNLHNVESEEQQRVYLFAFEKDDSGDVLVFNGLIPYKYEYFINDINVDWGARFGAIFTAEKLLWDKHYLQKQFVQYDYWRPGGHFYTWNPNFRREKCMLFGPIEDVFDGYYAHVDHVGVGTKLEIDPNRPIDPGNSYYSLRFYTIQAKYNRWLILSGANADEVAINDLVSSANLYNIS